MLAVGFSFLAALGFALTNILTQLGMRRGRVSPFTALLLNLSGGTISLAVAVPLLTEMPEAGLEWRAVLYFVSAGLITALVGQAALLSAIPRIGATRTSCFVLADNVFAVILGFIFLAQVLPPLSGVGIIVLMAGAAAFVWETAGGPTQAQPMERRQAIVGISMAVLAALCFASGGVLRGLGVAIMPAAVLGAGINIVAGLVVMVVVYAVTGRLKEPLRLGAGSVAFLLLSGVANALGTVGFILALQYGAAVAITTALKNTSPLFTFAFAIPLLRRHERLSLRLGLLVGVVVLGAVLIALGRL